MSCTVRVNWHGYLAFRLYWQGLEIHEGTKLKDTVENRERVEDRARVINQDMEAGVFNYLRWFPTGHLAHRFQEVVEPQPTKIITVAGFFRAWGNTTATLDDSDESLAMKQTRTVSLKWAINRAATIRANVLPSLGTRRLDEITPAHLTELQRRLLAKGLKPSTVDGTIHSALRAMLRDAKAAGYRVPDLHALYDPTILQRMEQGSESRNIDPYTEAERDSILAYFRQRRAHFHRLVMHQFWTGARPSEAFHLRQQHLDLVGRRIQIRGSRVLRRDGRTKTGKSKRDVVIHGPLLEVLRAHQPTHPKHDDFVFTTVNGAPIDEANFYAREWVPALRRLQIRPRPFYNTRHTYITYMLDIGANPLFVARQTGTSLEMIENHYGSRRVVAEHLDELIDAAEGTSRNPAGTLAHTPLGKGSDPIPKVAAVQGLRQRAGDRGRTGDVQLGKLAFYR